MRCSTGVAGNQRHGAASVARSQRPKRADVVDDPDAAAVGREHEVVLAVLERDVAHRDPVGKIVRLELRPDCAAVEAT